MRKRWLTTIHRLAKQDPRIVFIGSDLTASPEFKKYNEDVPDRFFMEGVSEAHIVGLASGIAMSGKICFLNTIATFITRRCFEQNVIDLGLAEANVRLLGSGGGLVYAPLGPTHLAIDDIAIMRSIPNMTVAAPSDADEMERLIEASVAHHGPMYIRVGKGGDPVISTANQPFRIGRAIEYRKPGKAVICSFGVLTAKTIQAADALAADGVPTGVLHFHTLKPIDKDAVIAALKDASAAVTVEEHVINGGLGSIVSEIIAEAGLSHALRFKRLGLPDYFPDDYGSQDSMLASYGLDVSGIQQSVKKLLAGQ